MNHTINKTELGKLNGNDLLNLISSEFHVGMNESFTSVSQQLEIARKLEAIDEELEFSLVSIKKIREKFLEHMQKEERLLFPLLSSPRKSKTSLNGENGIGEFIAELKEEHTWIRKQFDLINKATHHYECDTDSTPSHKLAFAQLNDLEQDFKKLFFIEEEYVFPRLIRQQFK
jgi:iron-sulfur cluster repair protein YtfE (RIC family)